MTDNATEAAQFAQDLSLILQTLRSHTDFYRALNDSAGTKQSKAELIERAFCGLSMPARQHLLAMANRTWTSSDGFLSQLETDAVQATWRWASGKDCFDRCLNEVFGFAKLVESNQELRAAVTDRRSSPAQRQELVRSMLSGSMARPAVMLIETAITSQIGTIDAALRHFQEIGADSIGARLTVVTVAKPLPPEQKNRLKAGLEAYFDATIVIQEIVDPSVLGGVRVECGAEVIDATMTSGLEMARKDFA